MKKVIIIATTALLNVYPVGCNTTTHKENNSDTAVPETTTHQSQISTNFRTATKVWSPAVLNTDSLLYWNFMRLDSNLRKWDDDRYTSL